MCVDGNAAPASVRYLNAQLAASWQNAHECAAHYHDHATVDLESASYKKSEYMRSLAEYYYAGEYAPRGPIRKDQLFFRASFGQPRLQFVCNHDAILHLSIHGHLNTNISKVNSSSPRINHHENIALEYTDVAIRMRFDRRAIRSEDSLIGNGGNIIQLMVLDFDSAKILTRLNSVSHDVLTFYVRKYLQLLRKAGHHVLFDLPDFDDDQYSPHIDYSRAITSEEIDYYCADIDIHGVHVNTVNERLRKLWLNAVVSARGLSGPAIPADRLSNCLLEIQSIWLPDAQSYFHIDFSPPTIRTLCSHEAVLIFDLNKVDIFETPDFDLSPVDTFTGWKVAFIVNTTEVRNEKNVPIGFNFDFHSVRFCPQLSTTFVDEDIAYGFFGNIVDFLITEYIQLLISYKYYEFHVLEIPVIELPIPVDPHHGHHHDHHHGHPGDWVLDGPLRRPIFGFDQIISISEESINETFATLWRHARDSRTLSDDLLIHWNVDRDFAGKFDALKVELLSDSKAIVRVNLREGSMILKGYEQSIGFNSWSLAFLVDIKMIELVKHELADHWLTRFKESALGRLHSDKVVKHLVLDFHNAQFLLDSSSLEGIWLDGILSAVDRLKTVVHHTHDYLRRLAHHGHHIIYSVPLVKEITEHTGPFALTSVAFQVVSYTTRTLFNVHRVKVAPVILITGMVKHHPLPRATLTWHNAWVARKAFGTIALSRETFLDGRLLPLFAKVNAKTTVLPRFPNPDEDEFSIHLSTLENHPYRRHKKVDWKLIPEKREGFRDYEYSHRDEWSYEHSGSFSEVGAYSVRCHTSNKLAIPTTYRPGLLEIHMSGESTLRIKGTDQHKDWSQTSRATWSTVIRAHSEWNGLRIDISSSTPVFDETEMTGNWSVNARDLLSTHLPSVIDIKEVLHQLKVVLEGTWDYAFPGLLAYNFGNPVFTVDGDLIVQLRVHDPHHKPTLNPIQPSRSYRNGPLTPVTPSRAKTYIPLSPSPSARSSHSFGLSPGGGTNGNYYGNGNHIAQKGNGVDGHDVRTPVLHGRPIDVYSPGPESPIQLFSA